MPKQRKRKPVTWQHPQRTRVIHARITVGVLGLAFIIVLLTVAGVGAPVR